MTFANGIVKVVGLAVCVVLSWSGGASAATAFSLASLKGRYVYQLEPATSFGGNALGNPAGVAAATRQHVMRVGFIDFDGLGGVGNARSIATTDDNAGQTIIINFLWTGTYSVNTDGTGTLAMATVTATDADCTPAQAPGVCATLVGLETYGFTIGKRYNTISLAQQNNVGGAKIFLRGNGMRQFRSTTPYFFTTGSLRARYKVQLEPATSFAAIAPGDPGGVALAARQDFMRVGYLDFDGFGNVGISRMIATTDDNTGSTVIISFQVAGTYTMNSDGTGIITLTSLVNDLNCNPPQAPGACATFEPSPQTFAFALSKSQQRLFLIQTNNSGGAKIFLRGEAEAQ